MFPALFFIIIIKIEIKLYIKTENSNGTIGIDINELIYDIAFFPVA